MRSGVLTSVHAFAADPTRGSGLLVILGLLLLPALALFAVRAPALARQHTHKVAINSQTFWMMIGVGLLIAMLFIVMIGTFYPMLFSAFGLGTLSVGAPYFNSLFVPLALLAALGAALSMLRHQSWRYRLFLALGASALSAAAMTYLQQTLDADFSVLVWCGLTVSIMLLLASVLSVFAEQRKPLAMLLAHSGFAITVLGATLLSGFGGEVSLKMVEGEKVTVGAYRVTHLGNDWLIGPNYTAERVAFSVARGEREIGRLHPEKRHYTVRTMNMSEAGVLRDHLSDVYITLGTKLEPGTYAVRIQTKPYVHLLWSGGIMMMVGGFVGAFARYAKAGKGAAHKGVTRYEA